MEKEDNVHGSALVVRDVEIKKPGRYEVIVKSPEGEMRANWDIYTTPEKPVARTSPFLPPTADHRLLQEGRRHRYHQGSAPERRL